MSGMIKTKLQNYTQRTRFIMRFASGMILGLTAILIGCGDTAGGVDVWEAVDQDNPAAIKTYSEAGGNLNVRKFDGSTPLFLALTEKKQDAYKALLEHGADPNIIMSGQRVVTHWAATEEDSIWLRLALEHGADPNLLNVGRGRPHEGTPLHYAMGNGPLENVKLLVNHGADINKPNRLNCSPITQATNQNDFDVVLYLLNQGADFKGARCGGRTFTEILDEKRSIKNKYFQREDVSAQLDAIQAWLDEHENQ